MAFASRRIFPTILRSYDLWRQWHPLYQSAAETIHLQGSTVGRASLHSSPRRLSEVKPSKRSVSFSERSLRVSVSGNPRDAELRVNSVWLRDHCRCSICYNSTTHQRSTDIVQLGTVSTITDASFGSGTDPDVSIVWNDGHRSTYALNWILDNWCNPRHSQPTQPTLWSGEDMEKRGGLRAVPYADVINDRNDALKRLLREIKVFGVGYVSGAPTTFEDTSRLCEIVALPEETTFGKFWKFSAENMDHADTAYSTLGLGAHTDLTYYSQTAGLQVFHLLEHSGGEGGSTLLVDGFKAAEELRLRDPKAFQFLSTKPIPCHYLDAGAHFGSEEPVIDVHSVSGHLRQIRFNMYDRAPLNTFASNEEVEQFYVAYTALAKIIRKPENEYWVKLGPGTIVFIDNFRVMHGRSAFTGKRVMCGCYLQRDSFLSKSRVLGV